MTITYKAKVKYIKGDDYDANKLKFLGFDAGYVIQEIKRILTDENINEETTKELITKKIMKHINDNYGNDESVAFGFGFGSKYTIEIEDLKIIKKK